MAQDTTPAIVVYQGDGTNRVFSIPFDAGSGVINVEFILRGATQTYEYSPLAFTVNDDNTALTWNGEPLQVGDFICISRSTTAHSLAMYEGDGVQTEFEIPFIRGFYGSIGVAFVYRGAAQTYEYEPKTFYVDADNTLLTWTGATLNAGDYIAIGRSTITGQPYELPNNQKHIEGALDNLSRQIQELKDRAVLVIDPTYRIGAPGKQNPIDWLKSIVRSKDFSVRGLRYDGKFLQFSLDDPDMPEHSKSWVSLLNTINVTTFREVYNEDEDAYYLQYSKDNGSTWHAVIGKGDIDKILSQANAYSDEQNAALENRINGKFTAINAQIDANADAIQKTREDFTAADQAIRDDMNAEDGRLQSQITAHASAITTNKNDIDELGDQVAEIESKIPESASETNPLVTKGDLANIDLDDYVKKSGDTMTGDLVLDGHDSPHLGPEIKFVGLGPNPSYGHEYVTTIGTTRGTGFHIKEYVDGDTRNVLSFYDGFWGYSYINDKMLNSGASLYPWKTTFTKALNAGNKVVGDTTSEFSGDLIVPSEGGTLARMEDLIDLRADINEADSELQTQITAQAAEIETKQDKLTAGDNIIISGNVISATGAGGGVGFDVIVVQELPESGEKGIIYLVPKDGSAPDTYDEYVWVTTTSTFELIGTTQVDLTGYVKNTDYANETTGGVIKTARSSFGTAVDGSGFLYAAVKTKEQYATAPTNMFMAKGTLENIKYDIVKQGVTASTIELTDDEKTAARSWISAVGNTDYATSDTGGVIKVATSRALTVSDGYLYALTKTLDNYATSADNTFIGKGTLENIKEDLVARAIENTVNTQNLTVGSGEGSLYMGVVAGTATIATNNGLDIVAQTKFDTAPTTDDDTTYANALDTSLVRKAQVATAIADAMANVDALPDQTGNAGKVLTTDGANAGWTEMPGLIIRRL